MAIATSTFSIEKFTQEERDRWSDCEGTPEVTLLRLGLLRSINKKLHAEKSRCLAHGLKADVLSVKDWELKVERLRESSSLGGDLMALLIDTEPLPKRSRMLPELLFAKLEREKLTRYDRKWEAAIAAEAVSVKWPFWCLDTWVQIPLIEEWDQTFVENLWPRGMILFSESSSSIDKWQNHSENDPGVWRGRWNIILDRKFKGPEELSLKLDQWPGAPSNAPARPQWKRLFP